MQYFLIFFWRQPSISCKQRCARTPTVFHCPRKLSQGFAFPKSCDKQDHVSSWCLLTVFEAFTELGSWTRSLVGVPGGQAYDAFLDGGSREQHCHILQTHNIVIFSWPEIWLFGHEINPKSTNDECTYEIKTTNPRDRICLRGKGLTYYICHREM